MSKLALDMRPEAKRPCEICGWPTRNDQLYVCSVPGFPVSLAHCGLCLHVGAFPTFCIDATLADGLLSMRETIDKHGLDRVLSAGADWFLESYVWEEPAGAGDVEGPGRYVTVHDYLTRLARK